MRRIPYADYRVNEVIPVIDATDFTNPSLERHQEKRLFRKRYGIKVEFHQSGRLGKLKLIRLGENVVPAIKVHPNRLKPKNN